MVRRLASYKVFMSSRHFGFSFENCHVVHHYISKGQTLYTMLNFKLYAERFNKTDSKNNLFRREIIGTVLIFLL